MITINTINKNFTGIEEYKIIWNGTALQFIIGKNSYIIPITNIQNIVSYPTN